MSSFRTTVIVSNLLRARNYRASDVRMELMTCQHCSQEHFSYDSHLIKSIHCPSYQCNQWRYVVLPLRLTKTNDMSLGLDTAVVFIFSAVCSWTLAWGKHNFSSRTLSQFNWLPILSCHRHSYSSEWQLRVRVCACVCKFKWLKKKNDAISLSFRPIHKIFMYKSTIYALNGFSGNSE